MVPHWLRAFNAVVWEEKLAWRRRLDVEATAMLHLRSGDTCSGVRSCPILIPYSKGSE
jgi:hypothetical protein